MKYLLFSMLSLTAFAQTQTNPAFYNCNAQTPTVNLELEVPFPGATTPGSLFGVPQDHQDGIGTCYANVSRNLIVGLSGGRDNPSYLDLALAYKRSERVGGLLEGGLDAGNICPTIEAARAQGYCPQERAPLETGARTEIAQNLGIQGDPLVAQANINQALRNFFARTTPSRELPVPPAILPRLRETIARLRSDSNITLPFPGMSVPFVPAGMFKNATMPAGLKGTPETLYQNALRAAQPRIMQAILQNKTPAEIYDIYTRELAPLFRQLNLTVDPENRATFIAAMTAVMEAPDFRDRIRATVAFLRQVSGRPDESEESFITFCATEFYPSIDILNTFGPVINALNSLGQNPEAIISADGNLLPIEEVFQLAIAPSCMNRMSRSSLSSNFTCDDNFFEQIKRGRGTQVQKIAAVRRRVVESLIQGIPVGRSFPQGEGGAHVNTIVGFGWRNGSCGYLIRDSMTGTSEWMSERDIYTESDEMSLVTRRP